MASLNRACILGRVGKDPEIRATQGGKKVASLSVATSETWTDKQSGERKENTQWHNVVCWNDGLCGVIESYVKKGDQIYIEGAIETRKWQDKDGNDRWSTEVVIKAFGGTLVLVGGKRDGDAGSANGGRAAPNAAAAKGQSSLQGSASGNAVPADDLDDDIPF